MKLLVIGCNGQLGSDLVRAGRAHGHEVACLDVPEIDITDREKTVALVAKTHPQIVINPAAYTAVDDAETNEALAFRVNADGAANVAAAAAAIDATVVHFSTDYVFDGTKRTPYVETDAPNPKTAYGRSKLAGEEALVRAWPRHLIFRIAWLYGVNGANFVKTILNVACRNSAAGTPLRVVDDQVGCPTHTVDVCEQVMAMLDSADYGLYHAVSTGSCSWFEFADRIVKAAGIAVPVVPCTTAEFPRPAPRPAYSVLENARLLRMGKNLMPGWETAFDNFWKRYKITAHAQ